MFEKSTKQTSIDKICHESECMEKRAKLSEECSAMFKSFSYCPYCAEEMTLVCHACKEPLSNEDYKFCPWCGTKFE